MSRVGPLQILLIVVVALLIFGPSKLPQLGKSVGDTIKEFKNSMKSIREGDEESVDTGTDGEKKD